eukprot:CAMPEP_0177591846 /NCGR_PEP_ID=MMETSP0419_2-20121207/8229_1 /TAXON_ID=582737 /ORGANISM="Tetraselmis sp., Strain GSL018" /LENGTH=478 /DNA_ID=CAMNT_0019082643 /DNA_START=732 /DNA_END=2168 /DNA_ORIENTATION=+
MLGDSQVPEEIGAGQQEQSLSSPQTWEGSLSVNAAICLLRGRAHLAMENPFSAKKWLKESVIADPNCYEAFAALVDNHLLTSAEERELVSSLKFPEGSRWVELLYRCKCKKYENEYEVESCLSELEAEPSLAGSSQSELRPAHAATGENASFSSKCSDTAEAACTLATNGDVRTCRAEWHYHRGQYQECYAITSGILERDPYHLDCLPVHLASSVLLGKKNELFIRAHRLVNEYPDQAISWFAIGCYHTCAGQHDSAQRYFGKCTSINPRFASGWIAFGNAFAALDEGDKAMSAYRTAARLFPGLHQPILGIGMEYFRMSNLGLAKEMFVQAMAICPKDPLVCNELAVVHYRNGQHQQAEVLLQHALQMVCGAPSPRWEPTIVNLGHVLRKQQRYSEALDCYGTALGLCPRSAGTYAAIGYTFHLMGDLDQAIDNYHKALGLRPDDNFSTDMLSRAMQEDCAEFSRLLLTDTPWQGGT